jgi:hypothetical protein
MKMITTAIVALFACAALANDPAPAAKTPAKDTKAAAPAATTATAPAKDCTKLTGKEKEACEKEAAQPAHK